MLTMFTGVVIPFGNGLDLRSESGTGAVEAVDSRVVFLTFEADVLEVARRFVAWSGIVVSKAYGWSVCIMAWSVDRIPKPRDLICVYTGWCELFLCRGSCECQVVRLFLWAVR